MPQDDALSYKMPSHGVSGLYVTAPALEYNFATGRDERNLEYHNAHPTRFHDADPVERTGYEGAQMYAATSRDVTETMGSMSLQRTNTGDLVTGADFKLRVKVNEGVINEEMAKEFVQVFAPAARKAILRVDILKPRTKTPQPHDTALIVFEDATRCAMARQGMLDKLYLQGMHVVQDASDDPPEPEEQSDPADDDPPKNAPKGPRAERRDPRTRKEKGREIRKMFEGGGMGFQQARAAARGDASGSSSRGGAGEEGSSSGHAGPTTASHRDAAAETEGPKPVVVDGSSDRRHHKHKHHDRKRHK